MPRTSKTPNANRSTCKCVYLMALVFLFAMTNAPGAQAQQNGHWLTGYYATYNGYVMSTSQVDYTKLTHIIYWPVIPNTVSPGTLDTTPFGLSPATFDTGAKDLVARAHAAGIKALIGIGGDKYSAAGDGNAGATAGFVISTAPANQAIFINNIVNLMQAYGFDGVDINWEQIVVTDNANFTSFIANLRSALNNISPNKLLTIAPEPAGNGGRPDLLAQVYQHLDQINIQTYVMSGPYCGWETWFNSPLNNGGATFISSGAQLPSVTNSLADYTNLGIPLSKLAMGIQFDSAVWTGGSGTDTGGVTKPKQSWTNGNNNCQTSDPGAPSLNFLPYREMITTLAANPQYTNNFDAVADQSWLSYNAAGSANDSFVSYDSPVSIAKKGVDMSPLQAGVGGSLGGVFIFELSGDFASAAAPGQQHPLLNAANSMKMLLPGLITNLTASANGSSVTLNWTAAPGAASYNVYFEAASGSGPSTLATNVTATQATIPNLTPGNTYWFVVKAANAFGLGVGAETSSSSVSSRVVWIPDYYGQQIQVRVGSGTTPTAITINLPDNCQPNSVAVNNNKLYVACNQPNEILVYDATAIRAAPAGILNIVPLKTITSNQFNGLIGITFDSSNNLWIASYGNNQVDSITAASLNTASPVVNASLIDSPGSPTALAFDTDGSLWVTGGYGGGILLNFPVDQLNLGGNATPRYCIASTDLGGGCQFVNNLFKEPEGIALFNGDIWVANNSSWNNIDGTVPGRELVDVKVAAGALTVNAIFGNSTVAANSPFNCPGGLFATSTHLWVNDESYGEANPQCGANGGASQVGGIFSFTPAQLAAKTTDITQVLTFTTITGRPGFGGLFVENDMPADSPVPALAQVTPVPTPTSNQNPSYTFSSTEAGAITYGGSCSSATTAAIVGNNTIVLTAVGGGLLPVGMYNNCTITVTDATNNTSAALAINQFTVTGSKILEAGRAIANWPLGVPAGEKRPVVVFLPGWGGVGNVDAAISGQNTNLVNAGYVTLAIGFDDTNGWTSNIDLKTKDGLDKLCADASIPANCNAIVLDGESYGGIQNYWIIEYLRANGYAGGVGNVGKSLGFVSEDAGYNAPGIGNWDTGAFIRTGLADTANYSVAMIQNLGDTTFPVDDCTWGNCGARVLGDAHLVRGDTNVFSICPSGGEHGTRGFANWDAWVMSAIKTMIHTTSRIPAFTGYTNPPLPVSNTCVTAPVLTEFTPVPTPTKDQIVSYTFNTTEAGTITYGGSCSGSTVATKGNNIITLTAVGGGPLPAGIYINCTITVTNAAGKASAPLAVNQFTVELYRWVRLVRTGTEFSLLQDAYNAAIDADVLMAGAAIFPEYLTFGSNKKITLRGGFDPTYVSNAGGVTTIRSLSGGGPANGNGGVTIEHINIR